MSNNIASFLTIIIYDVNRKTEGPFLFTVNSCVYSNVNEVFFKLEIY